MSALIDDFLAHTEREDPSLAKQLAKMGDKAGPAFDKALRRFDYTHTGTLDESERKLARRVLSFFHTPSGKGFDLLINVFDFLDVNESQTLEHRELSMAVEILEMFTKADSVNDTLSAKELEVLLAVLESLDTDGNGMLDEDERVALRDALWTPNEFLEEQKHKNEKVRKILGL